MFLQKLCNGFEKQNGKEATFGGIRAKTTTEARNKSTEIETKLNPNQRVNKDNDENNWLVYST